MRGQVAACQLHRMSHAFPTMSELNLPLVAMYRHRHVGLPTKGTPCTIRAAFRHWSSSAKYASCFSRVFCKAEYTRWLYSNTIIIKIHQPDELQQYSYITHAVTSATRSTFYRQKLPNCGLQGPMPSDQKPSGSNLLPVGSFTCTHYSNG